MSDPEILVAYDGSSSGRHALEHAAGLAGPQERVGVVNVVEEQSLSARLQTISDAQRTQQDALLREALQILAQRGVVGVPIPAAGDPVTEILAAAEARGARVLVVGSGKRHHLGHRSISARVSRDATCDVLVVH